MEGEDGERTSCTDESEEEENGLKNAYSVGDLLGELSSDNDIESKPDPDCTVQVRTVDSVCPDSNLSVENVTLTEKPDVLKSDPTIEGEVYECRALPSAGVTGPLVDNGRIYDEVLIENINEDPAEGDNGLTTSKYINWTNRVTSVDDWAQSCGNN